MKGVILDCLCELIIENFGKDNWDKIMTASGFDPKMRIPLADNVKDEVILKVVGKTCEVLGITLPRAADAFGDYWVNVYAPKIYSAFYLRPNNAAEFLLNMDRVHVMMTNTIPDAKPPRFKYEWEDEQTLVMTYLSERKLMDFFAGLARGVIKYFKETAVVTKIADNKIRIRFEK